ncbi:MAG: CvpA family protein [Planctomycetota bacterium]|nr:CvpA family protein [Planctomycetota bacterium]
MRHEQDEQREDDPKSPRKKRSALDDSIVLVIIALPALLFFLQSDLVSLGLWVFGGLIAITGFRTGFLEQFSLILSIAVVSDIGESVAKSIEDPIHQWIGLTGLANRILGCLLVAVTVTLVFAVVSRYMARKFLKKGNRERWNHWLGFISGGLIGLMILAYSVGVFSVLAQHQRDNTPQSLFGASGNRSPNWRAGGWIKDNGELIEQSTIGSAFVGPQPLLTVKDWSVVKDCRTMAAFLTKPSAIKSLKKFPAYQDIVQNKSVKTWLMEIKEDEELKEVFRSDRLVSMEQVILLLNHPAIMGLLDEPVFREKVVELFQQLDASKIDAPGPKAMF